MDCFLQNFGKGSRKIKSGVVKEEKISGVLLSSFSIFIPHSLSLYLYLSIYTSLSLTISLHSLYISLFTSLSQSDKKNNGPQYLLHIGGDRGPISKIDLAVCEYIAETFGATKCHTDQVDTNGNSVFVFSLQMGVYHGGCSKCLCHWRWISFEVRSLG